jgi:hypothetical protein
VQSVAQQSLDKGVDMKLGFHGATTMTADLQTDVVATAWEWDPMQLAVKAREAAINVLSPYFEI